MITPPIDLAEAAKAVFRDTGVASGSTNYSKISSFITVVHALDSAISALSASDHELYDSIHRRGNSNTRKQRPASRAQSPSSLNSVLFHLNSAQTQYDELQSWVTGIESASADKAFKNLKETYANAIDHITTSQYQAKDLSTSSGRGRRPQGSGIQRQPALGRR